MVRICSTIQKRAKRTLDTIVKTTSVLFGIAIAPLVPTPKLICVLDFYFELSVIHANPVIRVIQFLG